MIIDFPNLEKEGVSMYEIVNKRVLNELTTWMEVHAPAVARRARPGQFIILRVSPEGERIPLTIGGFDTDKGTVTIIFQALGATTMKLAAMNVGDSLTDFVGPLGKPSEIENVKRAAVLGGGLGVAIAYPQAKALHDSGAIVDLIVGFRTKDLIIMEEEMKGACTNLIILTDDGSNGDKGFVTTGLERELKKGVEYDLAIAIGPLPMMRAVCDLTRGYNLKTIVSMNSVMVDGTGMCGSCRLTVGGETKFACVDGPDFDGHQVDFDEAIRRSRIYRPMEAQSVERHKCRLTGGERRG
jgi:ferredoxin--NADP+ reductase